MPLSTGPAATLDAAIGRQSKTRSLHVATPARVMLILIYKISCVEGPL